MTLDTETERYVKHQAERRAFWLAQTPPDRKEALACLRRIDEALDRKARIFAVTPDGETIYDNASAMVKSQVAVNATDVPENVLTREALENGRTAMTQQPPKPPDRPEQRAMRPITPQDVVKAQELLSRMPDPPQGVG